eukprot:TRINITY_DN18588_c0_g1_i2.p1 TRINITY_DN18588_c0_g1~~TRINITY_DN18588_c0_g1_i2.p1  ORF type:complete len:154 (+),score=46.63 TRINITY_DN18588_c0_g1_i2:208-669(+)
MDEPAEIRPDELSQEDKARLDDIALHVDEVEIAHKQNGEAKTDLNKLRNGLLEWIQTNKQRENTLSASLDTCEAITDHGIHQWSLLREAQRKQAMQAHSIHKTADSVEKQGQILDDMGKTIDKLAKDSKNYACLLYTSPSPRDRTRSRMPSSA